MGNIMKTTTIEDMDRILKIAIKDFKTSNKKSYLSCVVATDINKSNIQVNDKGKSIETTILS